MEAAGERWDAGMNMAEFIISKIRKFIQKKERYDVSTLVMKLHDAQDYQICADNMEIEIRDGFNCNMVIQRYEKRQKIIIYIPCEWKKKIVIKVTEGKIFCCQRKMYQRLHLLVTDGEIICGEEN